MNAHHLILGRLTDTITGEILKDTHDERHRQKIARLLVDQKGYAKTDIEPRKALVVGAGDKRAVLKVDFIIRLAQQISMVIKYGPGSLVTRRRSALAISRLIAPYQVPVVVITNGRDAEIVNGPTGEVTGTGLEAIPSKKDLERQVSGKILQPVTAHQAEMESRILYCHEVDDSCECDE
ncbi:MAG: type I restriction enzyme HsdR N-terminal domain-containing protein, partial [Desulfobacterales bacterium]|nr:type I restriction enzyme HsdR N-terminal domain-containing protein [Desulfobacterales bacterium]